MTDLIELRDNVKAGTADDFGAIKPGWSIFRGYAESAYHGSLDAAKALHEAVLPGWGKSFFQWDGNAIAEVWRYEDCEYRGVDVDPARAWLLAILEVLIEQTEGTSGYVYLEIEE